MTVLSLNEAIDNIITSVNNDNEDLLNHIDVLKASMAAAQTKSIEIDPARLTYNNREGRKLMQSFFKKRGIEIKFLAKEAAAQA
jgi:hypothetical protein